MNDAYRGIGDNQPPEPTPLERAAQLIPECDDWTTRGPLTSEDEARVLSEFLVQIRKAREALRAGSMPDRQPHLDALAEIRATVAHLMEPHEKALEEIGGRTATFLAKLDLAVERIAGSKKVTGLLADWMSRERLRKEAEAEATKRAAEEAERIAERAKDRSAISGTIDSELEAQQAVEAAAELRAEAERKPERVRVKGDLAPKAVGLRPYWWAEIKDWRAAGLLYKRDKRVIKAFRDAVQKCADEAAREAKDPAKAPAGIEFHMREQVQ